MADILVESFNAAGYDNADWTEVVGAGSTVDEDSTDIADSAGGATHILKIAKVSPNFNAMVRHEVTSAAIVYLTGWVYVSSYTLASAGNAVALFELLDSGGSDLIMAQVRKTADSGNPVKIRAFLRGNEIGNYPASGSISTGQWYKIGLKYDNTNNTYDFSIDDTSVASGAMAGGNNVTRLKIGDNDNGQAFQGYFDEVHLSDSEYYSPSSDTELVPADAAHAHSADSPALVQAQVLAVAGADHAHAADAPALVQHHVLVVQGAAHGHAAGAPALVQAQTVAVADTTHGHAADSPTISSLVELEVADALHAHSALGEGVPPTGIPDIGAYEYHPPALELEQTQALAVDDATHAHAAESPALTQAQVLDADDAAHAQAADSPALAQAQTLAVDGADHGHTADSPTPALSWELAVDGASHAHAIDSPILSQSQTLAVNDAVHGHTAGSPLVAPGASGDEYQDTWARLEWEPSEGAVGYIIYQSDDGGANYTEVMRIVEPEVSSIKITGLTPSTEYYWGIRSYNAAGSSSMMSETHVTTRAAYVPSRFEKIIRKSKPRLMSLIETNPMIELTGWTLVSGLTYTYEIDFDEHGIELDALYENSVPLVAEASITAVSTNPGSYWHDTANKKVYLHTLAGDDPINYTTIGAFWLYFSFGRIADVVYNGHPYLPLIAREGLPDVSQEIQPFYKGTFEVSSGEVSFINGKVRKAFYFDRRFARYLWLNRKLRILAGGENFTYDEFRPINTGTINSISIGDRNMRIELRDSRDGLRMDIPTARYALAYFPLMDEDSDGDERPYNFGAMTDELPVCIDTTNRVYEFQHGRVKSVTATKNGAALAEDTDFYVDYQRGRLTLDRDLAWTMGTDVLLVSYSGNVNLADEVIATGPEIFLHICRTYLGLALDDMDLDDIYEAKTAHPTALSFPLRTATSTDDIFRKIEQSIQSYTMQDTEGRLGIRTEQSAPASGAPYIWDAHVFDFMAERTTDRIFSGLDIYYAEDRDGNYQLLKIPLPEMTRKHGVNKTLEIYTALSSADDAAALGTAIRGKMEQTSITFTVPRVLYTCLPGDVIPLNRNRFPSLSGTAANLPVRILAISKQISAGKTEITAEVV